MLIGGADMEQEKFKDRFNCLLKDPRYIPFDPFLKELKEKKKKLTPPDLLKTGRFNCSGQTIRNWTSGKSVPNNTNLEMLAELFGVSTSWLSGYIDTSKTDEINDYEPFKKLGFSYDAWKSLTDMYDSFLRTSLTRQDASTKMASTLEGINTILETINKMGYYTTIQRNKYPDVFTNPYHMGSPYAVPILTDLSNFLDVEDPSFVYNLTDFLDLEGYLEDRDYLNKEDEQVLQDFCNHLLDYNPKRLINPVENDLIIMGKLTEKIKQFKLFKIKEELQNIVYEITDDKNRDFREGLISEELDGVDDYLSKKYHYLYSLFVYYSADKN